MTAGPTNIVFVGLDLARRHSPTYQLAHGPLHCLERCRDTTALEEGLAMLFSLDNSLLPEVRSAAERDRLDPERSGYLTDVEGLVAIDLMIIKTLRRPPVPFERIEVTDLSARGVAADLAGMLCRASGTA